MRRKRRARCDDPVLFLEHKRLYRHISAKSREPNADYLIPFGKGRIKRQGNAATIVTWGATVYTALEIADEFDIEVIDLRTIVPMDDEIVFTSVPAGRSTIETQPSWPTAAERPSGETETHAGGSGKPTP